MDEQDHLQLRTRALRQGPIDVWSDDYSSERSPYAKTENSSGTATWSIRDDSNAELVVPQVMIHPNSPPAADGGGSGNGEVGASRKDIGHICLIVCGDSGIGKTALIQAFTMLPEITACEVAVDADYSSPSVLTSFLETGQEFEDEPGDDQGSSANEGELSIQETYASTMTLPDWSKDQEAGDHQIFIKNLCLVDTPGYGACLDAQEVISSVSSYIEWQFQKTNNMLNHMYPNTQEIMRLVHNPYGAHTHIDACLYIILDRVKRVDIEYMRTIHHLCNIIPVVVKNEQLTADQVKELRRDMLRELRENDIDVFDLQETPFVISDLKKDGVISHLKDAVLYTYIERLRRSTAHKFVAWRGSQYLVSSSNMSSTITASTLTTAETVDRIHALRTRHEQNINLFISRYVSEKRKTMERDMFERERALKSELASVERRKRAELLVSELNQLFQHGNMDDLKEIHLSAPVRNNDGKRDEHGEGIWEPGQSSSTLATTRRVPKAVLEQRILFVICLHFLLDVLSIIYSHN